MTPIQVFKGTWSLCGCRIALGFAIGFAFFDKLIWIF
jgi:hypothetical protein